MGSNYGNNSEVPVTARQPSSLETAEQQCSSARQPSSLETAEQRCSSPRQPATLHDTKYKYLRPILASIIASLGSAVVGTTSGYTAPAIPNLNSHPNPFRINPEEQSWLGSLKFIAGVFGAMFGSLVMDKWGRKNGLVFGTAPMIVGWVVMSSAANIETMYVARIITGFFASTISPMMAVYVSEISPPEIRGILTSFTLVGVNSGVLSTYIVGAFVPWNWLAVYCAAVACVMVVFMILMPETPRWLLYAGRKQEAIEALLWLRGSGSELDKELSSIQQSLTVTGVPIPFLRYLKRPLLKRLLVSQAMFIIMGLSGMNVIRLNMVSIFQEAGNEIDPYTQTIVVGAVQLVASCVGLSFVDYFERRTLIMSATFTMGASMVAMGIFQKIKVLDSSFAAHHIYWLPLASFMVFNLGFSLGYGPLPHLITNELFGTSSRGRANSFGCVSLNIMDFIVTKLFVDISRWISDAGAYCVLACVSFLGLGIFFFTIPKTKGKTLESTQETIPA